VDGVLTGSWLAARYGIEPRRIEAMRRAGELLAVRRADEYVYPSWQFDARGPRPIVASIVVEARRSGLDDEELYRLLEGREGLTGGGRRLADTLREGDGAHVLEAIRSRHNG
jgi:hypothetical protein